MESPIHTASSLRTPLSLAAEKGDDAMVNTLLANNGVILKKKVLDINKQLSINFAQVQLPELSQVCTLLGEQQDYATLEALLTTLWNTRDAQRSWPAQVLINIGRRLICARYLAGHPIKAIRLCEDIVYNLRRAHGPRALVTIETYELLAQLYTSAAQSYQAKASSEKTGPLATEYFKKALSVHENMLSLLVHENGSWDDSDDELDTAMSLLVEYGAYANGGADSNHTEQANQSSINRSALALRQLQLLKLAYQRLGGWSKPYEEYERLSADVFSIFGGKKEWKGVQGVEKWSAEDFGSGKAEAKDGAFEGLDDWGICE